MFAAMIGLLVFLWGLALPLSVAPAPIGPAAEQFADGARITVGLTLIAGIAGVVIGILAGLGKLSRFAPLRWLCELRLADPRHPAAAADPLRLAGLADDHAGRHRALRLRLCGDRPVAQYRRLQHRMRARRHSRRPARTGRSGAGARLSPLQTFIDVVLPQSMRVALPALANNLASLVKDSSLAYAISVVELTMVGYRVQAESYQPIPVFITIAAIYLILTTAFTTLTAALEAQLDVGQKR
jgi:polar amino acid transport system permease protein